MTDPTKLRFYQRPAFFAGLTMLISYLTLNFAYMSRGTFSFGYRGVALLELINGPENKFSSYVRIEHEEFLYLTILFPLLAVGLMLAPVTANRTITKALAVFSMVMAIFMAFFIEFALFDVRSRGTETDLFLSNSRIADAFSAGAGMGMILTVLASFVATVEGPLINVLGIKNIAVSEQRYYSDRNTDFPEDMRPYGMEDEHVTEDESYFSDPSLPDGEKIDFEDKTEPRLRKKDDFWES